MLCTLEYADGITLMNDSAWVIHYVLNCLDTVVAKYGVLYFQSERHFIKICRSLGRNSPSVRWSTALSTPGAWLQPVLVFQRRSRHKLRKPELLSQTCHIYDPPFPSKEGWTMKKRVLFLFSAPRPKPSIIRMISGFCFKSRVSLMGIWGEQWWSASSCIGCRESLSESDNRFRSPSVAWKCFTGAWPSFTFPCSVCTYFARLEEATLQSGHDSAYRCEEFSHDFGARWCVLSTWLGPRWLLSLVRGGERYGSKLKSVARLLYGICSIGASQKSMQNHPKISKCLEAEQTKEMPLVILLVVAFFSLYLVSIQFYLNVAVLATCAFLNNCDILYVYR